MLVNESRILIFGAGVIGSTYAIKFIEAGLDVTILARNSRLSTLREKGLYYSENGTIRHLNVKVIENLEPSDIYDFIFVPVRYEQAESALSALKENQSINIVTMINNPIGYESWEKIIGKGRLLPAFPSAGGEIKDRILYAHFGPKFIQATTFGEIAGQITERTKKLADIFEKSKLPYSVSKDMKAFQITHAAFVVAMSKGLYTHRGVVDQATAASRESVHVMTLRIKEYIGSLKNAGISITPSKLKIILICPIWLMDFIMRKILNTKLVSDILLGGQALNLKNEVELMDKDFKELLRRNNIMHNL
ncbi:MAG: 2-dehydropantoate 2-reductase N-terminal domain-containing protein [Bacillota bacterium]|nr:2-dehydropantoate 2-reductase N-terminal domain-containing protein [Bacillota bacterium]